ncbi:hypothetical protein CONLIGDRAFT_336896 [Coniochaeta ligniaria NRRL 30616]|uniref:Uncharacterized protein n=1 Tax=Coniochaeta ligniaria NRRL 30616 TaxID=1408157 RepID=A0A1J7JPI7_9PEZI|nr:hypothetical protein CONLIGDRAFT_336896 [Coniochaeta ligniaria NRRL 30616]
MQCPTEHHFPAPCCFALISPYRPHKPPQTHQHAGKPRRSPHTPHYPQGKQRLRNSIRQRHLDHNLVPLRLRSSPLPVPCLPISHRLFSPISSPICPRRRLLLPPKPKPPLPPKIPLEPLRPLRHVLPVVAPHPAL